MIYYQFVVKTLGYFPQTMQCRFRSKKRALKAKRRFIKEGMSGCLVTLQKDFGMLDVEEF